MLQNAMALRKSAPGPPNISDEHVSCTAPATENASCQILFKCPTPAIVFGTATKPSRFAHFWQGAQSLAPATRNDQKWSGHVTFLTFWPRHVLSATTACTFSTSQFPKVVRTCSVFNPRWMCHRGQYKGFQPKTWLKTYRANIFLPKWKPMGWHVASWWCFHNIKTRQ